MRPLGTLAWPPWVAGVLSVLQGATGCNTHQCDSDLVCIDGLGFMRTVSDAGACSPDAGGTPITGDAGAYNLQVSTNSSASGYELVWETTPIVGPWLDFPGQRTYVIQYPPGLLGHLPTTVETYVSYDNPDSSVDAPHMNVTMASGSLAELMNTTDTQLSVLNATCQPFSMRMVVRAQVGSADAGPDAP